MSLIKQNITTLYRCQYKKYNDMESDVLAINAEPHLPHRLIEKFRINMS